MKKLLFLIGAIGATALPALAYGVSTSSASSETQATRESFICGLKLILTLCFVFRHYCTVPS
jgi:hypothetical protein